MVLDVCRLIQQIAERPPLWDRRCHDYCQKPVVSKMWKEIASSHSVHEIKVRKRWKTLRDRFRQEVRKKPSDVTWPYFKDMLFLKSQFDIPEVVEEPKFDCYGQGVLERCSSPEVIIDSEIHYTFRDESSVTGFEYSTDDTNSNREVCFRDLDDEDYHFLLSLLPAMKRLPLDQKFLFRIKLMEFINKEIYQQ